MQYTKLEPGTYRLTKTIQNPRPDRRARHDWRLLQTWHEGMIFRVQSWGAFKPSERFELWHGPWCATPGGTIWEHIAPHLQRIDEKPSDFLKREHPGMSLAAAALDLMVANGVVTLDQVKEYLQRALDE